MQSGQGAALGAGMKHATGGLVIIQDADLQSDPKENPMLMEPVLKGRVDVVLGSRFLGGGARSVV
jgi:glycosyltransferase involved in cell wall biosynthesis